MRAIQRVTLILLIFALSHGTAAADLSRSAKGVVPESARLLDITTLNARIKNLSAARKASMTSPIPLVLEIIGGTEETPHTVVDMSGDAGTDFKDATVTVIRDGFQDDSVRGDWHEFILSRQADDSWTVRQARQAFRCWRGGVDKYAARNCP